MKRCKHYECRCARARELADQSDEIGRAALLFEALRAHLQDVPCRKDDHDTDNEPLPA